MVPAAVESRVKDCSSVASSPPRAENPQTQAANANQESARGREGFYLHLGWVETGCDQLQPRLGETLGFLER